MTKKITKAENIQYIMNLPGVANDQRAIEFLQGQLDKLNEQAANRQPTLTQIENEKLNAQILELMEPNRLYLTSEVICLNQAWVNAHMSTTKMSSRLNDLFKQGKLTKTVSKGRSYFQLAI